MHIKLSNLVSAIHVLLFDKIICHVIYIYMKLLLEII